MAVARMAWGLLLAQHGPATARGECFPFHAHNWTRHCTELATVAYALAGTMAGNASLVYALTSL